MAETKVVERRTETPEVKDRGLDFWTRYQRPLIIGLTAMLVLVGGYFGYKYGIQQPKEQKASEAIFKAQQYYQADSMQLALNGDGVNPGFLKIIDNYGGTKSGNLARFYAGSAYLSLGNAANAEKHLEDFETDSKLIQARGYKLLADAYAEQGKNGDALAYYKKAARHFEEDDQNASEYLFMAAYF